MLKQGRLVFETVDDGASILVTVDKGGETSFAVKFPADASVEMIQIAKDRLVDSLTKGVPFDFMIGSLRFINDLQIGNVSD